VQDGCPLMSIGNSLIKLEPRAATCRGRKICYVILFFILKKGMVNSVGASGHLEGSRLMRHLVFLL